MPVSDQLDFTLWVLFAVGIGGLIGLQREFRGHEAGVRTSALVCGGAAMFGNVSHIFGDDRIAAGVVQGIGFLGAGLIMQGSAGVRGATTAVTVWMLAALGLMAAEELWLAALILAATFIVLLELAPVSDWIYRKGQGLPGSAPPPAEEGFGDDDDGGGSPKADPSARKE